MRGLHDLANGLYPSMKLLRAKSLIYKKHSTDSVLQ